jgi:hypothetical protein
MYTTRTEEASGFPRVRHLRKVDQSKPASPVGLPLPKGSPVQLKRRDSGDGGSLSIQRSRTIPRPRTRETQIIIVSEEAACSSAVSTESRWSTPRLRGRPFHRGHLALLRAAGVLRATKPGRTVLYEIQFDTVAEALRGIADALERARVDFDNAGCCAPTTIENEGTP